MQQSRQTFTSADEAEQAFYAAFNQCDANAMAQIWAADDVICIHPGSQVIVGYEAVLRSWRHILTNAELPEIKIVVLNRLISDMLVVHLVEERITTGDNYAAVLATNVYKKYPQGWLMVEHHGSLLARQAQAPTLQ
jgi:ketosteroid isomerase-like protein